MGKKKKEPVLEAWCWYCDRDFADDKVLLEHQKAKHYRCPYCPRRLNTAGGLTVHLHQVHKAEPTKIENALPGRESFDVEIYGMVGIPEADLAEWRSRRANRQGGSSNGAGPAFKRQRVENVALTPDQLKAQLEAHKALMSGKAPPPGAMAGHFNPSNPGIAPSPVNMMGYPMGPPPGFGVPPPPMYNRPPPGFGPPPVVAPPPPGVGSYAGPPPGFYPNGPPPPLAMPPPRPSPQFASPSISLPLVNPHQEAVKNGAKSRMVYVDITMSPEEKLASTSKYLYIDPEDTKQTVTNSQAVISSAGSSATGAALTPQYYGPPPGFATAGPPPPRPISSPYAGSPHSPFNGLQQQQQPQQQQQQGVFYGAYGSPQPPGPPAGLNYSVDGTHPHAQSYPAISAGGIEPASQNPEDNTAEALAKINQSVGAGVQREVEMGQMESQSKANREQGIGLSPEPVGVTEVSSSQSSVSQGSTRQGRARAADLF